MSLLRRFWVAHIVLSLALALGGSALCQWTLCGSALAASESLEFDGGAEQSVDSGYITLKWPELKGQQYQVEMAAEQSFESPERVYEGMFPQVFLSGLRGGDYYFRLRTRPIKPGNLAADRNTAPWSDWSSPKHVQVTHHSLVLTFSLFGTGAVVFFSIVAFVFHHERQRRRAHAA